MTAPSASASRLLVVKVTPRASCDRLAWQPDGSLKVYVTCAPSDGQANHQVLRLIAKAMRVPKSSLSIVKGHASRNKVIAVDQ